MARRRNRRRRSPRTRVVYRRAKRSASAGLTRAKKEALNEKHTLLSLAAGALLGVMEAKKVDLPYFKPLGPAATYGLGLWAFGRYSKNQTASHMATGLLSIAAFQMGLQVASDDKPGDDKVSGLYMEPTNEEIMGTLPVPESAEDWKNEVTSWLTESE